MSFKDFIKESFESNVNLEDAINNINTIKSENKQHVLFQTLESFNDSEISQIIDACFPEAENPAKLKVMAKFLNSAFINSHDGIEYFFQGKIYVPMEKGVISQEMQDYEKKMKAELHEKRKVHKNIALTAKIKDEIEKDKKNKFVVTDFNELCISIINSPDPMNWLYSNTQDTVFFEGVEYVIYEQRHKEWNDN